MMNKKTKHLLLIALWIVATLFFLGIIQDAIAIANTDLYIAFKALALRSSHGVTNSGPYNFIMPAVLYYTVPLIATLDHLGKLNPKQLVSKQR